MASPFKVNPKKKTSVGVDAGDPYYHTAKIMQVIEDESIVLKVVDDKTSIKDTIEAYRDKTGLKNILALYLKTGDKSLFEARSCLNGIDATNIPTKSPDMLAKSLPADLIKGKSIEEIKSLTIEDLVKFYSKPVEKVEEGGSKDGE